MILNRLYTDLLKSVREGDLKLVKYYLSRSDFLSNYSTQERLGLLIHETTSSDIAKELLNHGAEVDARNSMRETPLHSAVTLGKNSAFIKELLRYGASVYASDYKGSTPLYLEVKKSNPNLEIIKILLEYEADINMPNQERRQFGIHCSALDVSVRDLAVAKLLIKYYLLQNYETDYCNVVNLKPYEGHINYDKLSAYLEECASEITKLKLDKLKSDFSFYRFLTDDRSVDNLFTSTIDKSHVVEEVLMRLIHNEYSVYQDIILEKLGRQFLLNKINGLLIFTDSLLKKFKKRIALDHYSTPYVTKYLSNYDILNLIKVYAE